MNKQVNKEVDENWDCLQRANQRVIWLNALNVFKPCFAVSTLTQLKLNCKRLMLVIDRKENICRT